MKATMIALGLLVTGLPLLTAANSATLRLPDGRSNFFAGSRISIPVEMHAREQGAVRLSWSLQMAGAVIARREIALDLQQGEVATHALDLELPQTRDGIALKGLLRMALTGPRGEALDEIESPLYVFDPDPFQYRQKWLKDLNLHVYDPEGATVAIFEQAGIPFSEIMNPAAFESAKGGILIIGENLSLRESRGLMEAALQALQAKVSIVVLAPVDGEFQLPGMGTTGNAPQPAALSFYDRNIITRLDKRLDLLCWTEGRDTVSRYFQIGAHRSEPEIMVSEDQGWPWIALDWKGGRRARLCGFAIIRDWEKSPAPRYLLAALLEQITRQSP